MMPPEAIPSSTMKRYRAVFVNPDQASESFLVPSADMSPRSETKTASWVRYEQVLNEKEVRANVRVDEEDEEDDDYTRSAFGEVRYFFSISPEEGHVEAASRLRPAYKMAFIEWYPVYADGLLVYSDVREKPKLELVPVEDIKELIGLLKKEQRRYIVGKTRSIQWKRDR